MGFEPTASTKNCPPVIVAMGAGGPRGDGRAGPGYASKDTNHMKVILLDQDGVTSAQLCQHIGDGRSTFVQVQP